MPPKYQLASGRHPRRRFTRRTHHVRRHHFQKRFHRRFPAKVPYRRFMTSEIKHSEDQVFTRMHAIYYLNVATSTVAAVDPNTGMSGWVAIPMNNISSLSAQVTANSTATVSMATADPQGLTEMMNIYANYQVRGTRFDIDFLMEEISGTTGTRPTDVVTFPLDQGLYATFAAAAIATNPFERYAQQPNASHRKQLLKAADYLDSGVDGAARMTIFDSPSKIRGVPLYYSQASSSGSYTTAPTDTPRFVITWAQEGSHGAAVSLQYRIRIKATYAVVFYGRNLVPYNAIEPAVPVPPKPDLSEAEFDSLPELKLPPPALGSTTNTASPLGGAATGTTTVKPIPPPPPRTRQLAPANEAKGWFS